MDTAHLIPFRTVSTDPLVQRNCLVGQVRALVVRFGAAAFDMPEYDELHRAITLIDRQLEEQTA